MGTHSKMSQPSGDTTNNQNNQNVATKERDKEPELEPTEIMSSSPKTRKSRTNPMNEAAMKDSYYICHNVQDFLWFRGYRYRTREEQEKRDDVFREFLATLAPR